MIWRALAADGSVDIFFNVEFTADGSLDLFSILSLCSEIVQYSEKPFTVQLDKEAALSHIQPWVKASLNHFQFSLFRDNVGNM